MSSNLPANPLDHEINSDLMRVCKCVVPYLDRNMQKNIAIGIKLLELVNTINLYGDEERVNEISLTRSDNWENDLLNIIRDNVSSDKAYVIDAIVKLSEFRTILATQNSNVSPTSATPSFAQDEPSFYNEPYNKPEYPTEPIHTPEPTYFDDHTMNYPRDQQNLNPVSPPSRFGHAHSLYEDQRDFVPTPEPPPNTSSSSTSGPPPNILDAFSPFINEEQKQLLSVLANMLGGPKK